jgi:hypothetical protein
MVVNTYIICNNLTYAEHQECVICRKTYINESDVVEWERSQQTTVIRPATSSAPKLNVPNLSVSTITDAVEAGQRSQNPLRAQALPTPLHDNAVIAFLTYDAPAYADST